MTGWTSLALIGQAAAAVAGVLCLVLGTFRRLGDQRQPGMSIVLDVWAPVAIVLPLLFLAPRVGTTVEGAGWTSVGAPACLGIMGLGGALWRRARSPGRLDPGLALTAATVGAGVLLLLLSAAHDLTIWTGQSAFAIGALLLWINTPGPQPAGGSAGGSAGTSAGTSDGGDGSQAAGAWLAVAVLLAAAQGALAFVASAAWPRSAATIAVGYGLFAALGAAAGGPAAGLRVGAWAATLGTLFGIGTLSVVHLAPMSFGLATRANDVTIDVNVARGFGFYAAEALLIIALPALAVLVPRGGGAVLRLAALVAVAGGLALATWRLLAI